MKMTSKLGFAVFALAVTLGMTAVSHDHNACTGFVPENDMKIPVGFRKAWRLSAPAGLTEDQFNDVLTRIEEMYTDEVAQAGGKLVVKRLWSNGTVNASAQQLNGDWIINMYGGLARHPATTIEGFALVACHEMGHHLGGAPKVSSWFGNTWATNEGGSDYYATLKCLRRFFADEDNAAVLADKTLEPITIEKCESQFAEEAQQLLCKRISLAGESVAYLFMDLRKETTKPRFDTPDTKTVTRTNDNHPATQCRMDTYFAGLICDADVTIPVSNTDYRQGTCTAAGTLGLRPLCWFKPDAGGTTPVPPPRRPGNEDGPEEEEEYF